MHSLPRQRSSSSFSFLSAMCLTALNVSREEELDVVGTIPSEGDLVLYSQFSETVHPSRQVISSSPDQS